MKKIFFALSMLALLYTSCDPSSDSGSTGFQENVTAESVAAKVAPVEINGKKTNLIVVENNSPINQQWTASQITEDPTVSAKAYDTIYVTQLGENEIKMQCKNANVDFTKSFKVNVEDMYYLTSTLQKRLCINSDKSTLGNYVSAIKGIEGQKVQFGCDFDPSKVEVVQEKDKDGKLGNKFTVVNKNTVLSDWKISNPKIGDATSNLNSDELLVGDPGEYELTLTYTKADGTKAVGYKETFKVETLSTVPTLFTYLAGEDGTGTTWEWNPTAGNVWGNGNINSDTKPTWWGVSYDDIDGQGKEKPGTEKRNGKSAYFKIDWKAKKAINSDGTELTFKVNPLEHNPNAAAGWDVGTITFDGASGDNFVIPMGVDVNSENKKTPFQKFYVLRADGKRLVLAAEEIAKNSCGWFYMFRLKESKESK